MIHLIASLPLTANAFALPPPFFFFFFSSRISLFLPSQRHLPPIGSFFCPMASWYLCRACIIYQSHSSSFSLSLLPCHCTKVVRIQ
ncbi:uncharacterized protein B0I36DRAFT_310680 [Microdochium trichocladiopsis]|uniref:Uncharacterized protein n=1 Tax=Microdochium trichocladiopsis TaxID=1682393 RepID=A0A9P9BW48_9PEZI|nr:uncharacterized protein B0I36DRAFT_310680 [Microdochium trichocladiopsis]KAH7040437.1 hypothetical protein B0I36DRAFT_310680 [Microdochium trichocladiopsis]